MKSFILFSVLLTRIKCQSTDALQCSQTRDIPCVRVGFDAGVDIGVGLSDLPRRDPGKVGDVVKVDVGAGRTQTLITRAQHPPLFELPDFLTHAECDHMISLGIKSGMKEATMFGDGGMYSKDEYRTGQTTFVAGHADPVLRKIQNRAAILTGLPKDMLYHNEEFQIGLYDVGGFYKFHYDSHPTSRDVLMRLPCCQHKEKPHTAARCTVCRYVTILMYLNDVEEGGETAFPLADKPGHNATGKNLKTNCKKSPVLVPPKKGRAMMWYNNIIDPEHGWLGVIDPCSLHGGCPIRKGNKWISNLWINAPQYHSVNKKTIYHDEL